MPTCTRINKYRLKQNGEDWFVTIHSPLQSDKDTYRDILGSCFQGARLVSAERTGIPPGFVWESEFTTPITRVSNNKLVEFLNLLNQSVTILDCADESHALGLHHLYHPNDDPDESDVRKRTELGVLMKKAKSYDTDSGDEVAASELAALMVSWVKAHPRYSRASFIISAPPGDTSKKYDLPRMIVSHLSKAFGFGIINCQSKPLEQPQKSIEELDDLKSNISGNFLVAGGLYNRDVVIIDDIYRSGATINELTRACREAGAKSVLSLTGTKTARFCKGLPPHADKWPNDPLE